MTKPLGGRGKTAPYETTHVRVPVPIKDKVDKLVNEYRESLIPVNSYDFTVQQLPITSEVKTFAEALEVSHAILRSKKSARESLAKLLTLIYGQDIKPSDL